ncbi:uncharacterized protein LOC129323355 [Eublepharis macularius]|uniref:Uncharacterized protein LOC129323355 n=1 Tax=Eublepharis macularius TaxID=481883 RepID=A0AA97KMT7_EUBMA|nr:uncharacterized protein LOC129323355 [Eublepharis macularius]XP_054825860.1 uncharacterized protein LOC129323355 [Eublepharis macularius]
MLTNPIKKKKNNLKTVKNLQTFFAASGESTGKERSNTEKNKMAELVANEGAAEVGQPENYLDPQLIQLKQDIIEQMAKLISPITTQLADIKRDLQSVNHKADKAMEVSVKSQQDINDMQKTIIEQQDRLMKLELNARQNQIKIRGIDELLTYNTDLTSFIANWLAKQLKLEEGVYPYITKTYRVGPYHQNKNKDRPRDIIIEIPDQRTRKKIMEEARARGSFKCEGKLIYIFADLPKEVLAKRRELKPISETLQRANRRYKWLDQCKLMVFHQGKKYIATDVDTGLELLNAVGLETPMETNKQNQKRKSSDLLSPQKGSKIPIRDT